MSDDDIRDARMNEAISDDDARLLADLGQALGPDTPPDGLVARAQGLIAYADLDHELLELLDESAASPVGSRGPSTRELLAFELADGSITFELSVGRDRLDGQLLSGEVTEVTLDARDRPPLASSVDALGRFSLSPVPTGPVRLRLRDGSGRPLATDWFLT